MKTEKLLLQKDGPIGWIIFNQPEKRNAVSQEMWQAMPEYVADLAADPAIRVVILRGAGEAACVAGGTRPTRRSTAASRARARSRWPDSASRWWR